MEVQYEENGEPVSVLQVIFANSGSAHFKIETKNVSAFQMLALAS